jgi:hypothetical protein
MVRASSKIAITLQSCRFARTLIEVLALLELSASLYWPA